MSFPVFKLQSKNRAFNLRPLIEQHVRISRMLLSFQTLGKFDQKVSQIPTIIGHANPLWGFQFSPPVEASNFPKWRAGRRLAHPTSGSLALRAEDRLRLFRKLLEKVLSKMLSLSPLRGTPCHCWLLHNPSRRRMFLINLF